MAGMGGQSQLSHSRKQLQAPRPHNGCSELHPVEIWLAKEGLESEGG